MADSSSLIDIRNAELAFKTTRELQRKKDLQRKYTGNWVWRAVSAFIDLDGEKSRSLTKMAEMLSAPLAEVVEAVEGLEELGIIQRTEQGYRKILKYVYFSDRELEPQSLLQDHVLISTQVLHRLHPTDPTKKSFYRTGFVASTESLVKEFCIKMEFLMKEFIESSNKAKPDRVVAFSFSNVKLSRSDSE